MKINSIFISSICLMVLSSGKTSFSKDLEQSFIKRKYSISSIKKISINDNSAKSFSKDASCEKLFIDEKRIRFFLENARIDNGYNYSKKLAIGDCYAEGLVLFNDGRRVRVSIDNWTGTAAITDKNTTYFMSCEPCSDILDPDFIFDPRKKDDE